MIVKGQNARKPLILGLLILTALLIFGINKEHMKLEMFAVLDKAMAQDWGMASVTGLYGVNNIKELGSTRSEVTMSLIKLFPERVLFKTPEVIYSKLRGFPERPALERIDLDIKFTHYKTILNDRKRALEHYRLMYPEEVPAKIRYNGETYRADIRLKGDLYDHWRSKTRMSLRVDLKDKKTINGYNRFSIQKPGARQFPYDQVFQAFVHAAGGLSSRHNYMHVYVNGENWGVMNIEEHMSKQFLEKQESKDSLIFKFVDGEKGFYQTLEKGNSYKNYRLSQGRLFSNAYQEGKYFETPLNRDYYSYVMQKFITEDEQDIVDVESFLREGLAAVAWNNRHTIAVNNVRAYFNPYTLKLEPITTDQGAFYPLPRDQNPLLLIQNDWLFSKALMHPDAEKFYPAAFSAIASASKKIPDIYDDYQHYFPYNAKVDFSPVFENIKIIEEQADLQGFKKAMKEAAEQKVEQTQTTEPTQQQAENLFAHVHMRHYDNGEILIFNLLDVPVTLQSIYYEGKKLDIPEQIVPPYTENDGLITIKTDVTGIQDEKLKAETVYKGVTRTVGSRQTFTTGWHNPFEVLQGRKLPSFIRKVKAGSYQIQKGTWNVTAPVLVDGDLNILPGAKLTFAPDAYMIVKGALTAKGTSKDNIVFKPAAEHWKGLYVVEASAPSVLEHVTIMNTQALEDGLLSLTGGITFYKSPVTIDNTNFQGTVAEDALNIVKSDFTFKNSVISGTRSDAFDGDFCKGEISNLMLKDVGGDGIDFSGSTITVKDLTARNIHDKAISAGEKSTLVIEGGSLKDIGVGVASKDGSDVKASKLDIAEYKLYAGMTYVKKSMFGPSRLEVNDTKYNGGLDQFLSQNGSTLFVDGTEISPQEVDVDELYNTDTMRK